jgi:hypothetical protein
LSRNKERGDGIRKDRPDPLVYIRLLRYLRYMEITLRIPDDFARLIGTTGNIERRALEALALDEFRQGHLNRAELRQLLGFATRGKLDEFLTAHGIFGTYTPEDLERDRRDLARLGF